MVMLASSAALSEPLLNGVSVVANVPATGAAWTVVPKANMPLASGNVAEPANAALLVQLPPAKLAPAPVLTSFTTTELGRTPVRVLLIRSLFTESEANPFGVIRQEQQETNCSSGENAYTFTQMLPTAPPNPGPFNDAPLAPVLVRLITESPDVDRKSVV